MKHGPAFGAHGLPFGGWVDPMGTHGHQMQGPDVEVTCTNLMLVRIWKEFNNYKRRRDMVVGKMVAHLCLTLITKELKFSVEHDRMVTTLNTIKLYISYLMLLCIPI